MEPRPVAEVLREYSKEYTRANKADVFAAAFEDFPYKALSVIGGGKQTDMVIELEGDKVLKISRKFHPWGYMGKRKFDAPILEEGHYYAEVPSDTYYTGEINWHIQPKVKMDAGHMELGEFEKKVKRMGYNFVDPHASQIGRLDGRLVLVDLYAVQRKAAGLKESKPVVAQNQN